MSPESQALLRLQEIDLELMRIEQQVDAMPQRKKLVAIQAAERNLSGKLTAIVGQRKDAEMELEENAAAHEKTTNRVAEVQAEAAERAQDFRGVRDLEAHLTALAKQLEKIEFKRGELEANLERLLTAEQKANELLERLSAERLAQQESLRQGAADLMARARTLGAERKGAVATLPAEVVATYERATKRFGGLGVERLHGNVPTICRVKLHGDVYKQLKRAGSIVECPYCHRMLVTEED